MHALSKQTILPTVKTVILDTHDGAFTDDSVKVRPHKFDVTKVALKCKDPKRLAKAALAMGLKPCGKPVRGAKHWILFCWKADVAAKLFGAVTVPQFAPVPSKLLTVKAG